MICRLCHADTAVEFIPNMKRNSTVYTVYYCSSCMSGFTDPVPSREELSRLYATAVYRADKGKRFNSLVEYVLHAFMLQRIKRIARYRKNGDVLDIGCGRGSFLYRLKQDGWRVAGTEFNDETASYARESYGIDVFSELSFPDSSFDVITMNHVLEHMDEPTGTIRKCYRLLRVNGLLVVAVPNFMSLQAVAAKGAWLHLDLPYHLYHFSEGGLKKLLMMNNFRIIKTRRFDLEHNPFGWLQTLLNMSGVSENFLYNFLKVPELRKAVNASRKDLIFSLVLIPVYFPLSIILSIIESFLFKRGGTVELWAVKGE